MSSAAESAPDAAHDRMHRVTMDDPEWTETVWFVWMVPERHLTGYFYPVFRPNLGIRTGGVLVFDESGVYPWELPIFSFGELAPMVPGEDLLDMALDNGMWLRCVEPGSVFEFGYADDELEVRLRFEAVVSPTITLNEAPFAGAGHLDQVGRVTGQMMLHGESIDVNCFGMRDRSWGPRRFRQGIRVGYSYATASDQDAFLVVSSGRIGRERVRTGYLVRDGHKSEIVSGARSVERDHDGRPSRVQLDVRDADGREMTATGAVVSRQVFTPYPSMLSWDSMVRWDWNHASGWGEDQDVWHPRDWRDSHR